MSAAKRRQLVVVVLLATMVLTAATFCAQAQETGDGGWVWLKPDADGKAAPAGQETLVFRARMKATSFSADAVSVRAVVEGVRARARLTKGGRFTELGVSEGGVSGKVGAPALPALRRLVEVPVGAKATVSYSIVAADGTSLDELGLTGRLMPVQAPIPKVPGALERAPFDYDADAYARAEFTPDEPVRCTELGVMRGRRLFLLEVFPVAYNPKTGGLTVYWKLDVKVSFIGGAKTPATGTPALPHALEGLVLNPPQQPAGESKGTERMLIISGPTLLSGAQSFGTTESARGLDVTTASTDTTGTTTTAIKAYIQTLYDVEGTRPDYLLLVGDTDTIPHWPGTAAATDLYYVCMDGAGDWLPDIAVGRWSVRTTGQLSNIVDKTTYYENGVFASTDWIKHATFMASSDNYTISEGTHNDVISSYLDPRSYTSDKLYCVTYSATTQQVRDAFNDGRALGIYSGHGSETSWADGPAFAPSDVTGLTNANEYPFVCSFACLTGAFDVDECFAETWIRAANGAVAFFGSSISSYWGEDDILEKSLASAIYDEGMADFGEAILRAKILYLLHFGESASLTHAYFEQYNLFGSPATWLPTQLLAADAYETDDIPGQASVTAVGTRHGPHSIHTAGDVDYVTFTSTGVLDVVIETLGQPGGGDTTLALYDATETLLASDNDSGVGTYSRITYDALPAGTYYVAAREDGDGTIREYYIAVATGDDMDIFEPDSTFGQARTLSANNPHGPHTIDPIGDVDFVTFTLGAETDVTLETSGDSGGDTIMYLYNASETLLSTNDNSGEGSFSLIECSPLAAGTYYVAVKESGEDATVPPYFITLSMLNDAFEPDNAYGDATPIAMDDVQGPHSIDPETDQDWVTFALTGTTSLMLETSGPSGDTVLYLYDASLTELENDDDGGDGYFSLIATELPAGTYYAKVISYVGGEVVPEYYISLSEGTIGDAFEPDDTAGLANGLTPDVPHGPHSCFPDYDLDYMVFTLTGTSNISVETSGPTGDTYMYLLNSSEDVIAQDDDGGAGLFSLITYDELPAGTYYVAVEEYGYEFLEEYYVTLTVTPSYAPLTARVTGIEWSNDAYNVTVTYEANRDVVRYYHRIYQLGPYESSASPVGSFGGLETGYYMFVGTCRDGGGTFPDTPCRAWFYNRLVGEDFQVYIESYTIDHDTITFNLNATNPASAYYVRLYGVESGYTRNTTGVATYSGLSAGLHYFVANGKEAGTGNFPAGGPARQFFYIVTDGFDAPPPASAKDGPASGLNLATPLATSPLEAALTASTGRVDSDGDGLADAVERELGLNPYSADSDRDGIPDAVDIEITPILEVFPNATLADVADAELVYEVGFELTDAACVYLDAAASCQARQGSFDALSLTASLEGDGVQREVMVFDGKAADGIIAGRERALYLDAGRYTLRFHGTGSPTLYWVKAGYVPSADRVVLKVPEGAPGETVILSFALDVAGSLHVEATAAGAPVACALDGSPASATVLWEENGACIFDVAAEDISASEHTLKLTFEVEGALSAIRVTRAH